MTKISGRTAIFLVLPIVLFMWTAPEHALAQNGIAIETFHPIVDQEHNTLGVYGSETSGHLVFSTGIFFHSNFRPLVVLRENDIEPVPLVDKLHNFEVMLGLGLSDYLDIAFVLPLVAGSELQPLPGIGFNPNIIDNGAFGDDDETGVSDIRFSIKGRPWLDRNAYYGIGLAFALTLHTATDSRELYGGPTGTRLELEAVVDYEHSSGYSAALNLGYLIYPDEGRFFTMVQDDGITWALALRGPTHLIDGLEAMLTFYGTGQLSSNLTVVDPSQESDDALSSPAEMQIALRYFESYGLNFHFGVGFGLNDAVGSPSSRLLASVGFTDRFVDVDEDGIADYDDDCPKEAEDIDGYNDTDGCPELDNDSDGVLDHQDQCKNEPEDSDGFMDEDGCPEDDNDQDTLIDFQDTCPNEPEDWDGYQDEDGCPDIDHDGDGLDESVDQCPIQTEDPDGYQDDDGCPDPDNDGDGLLDANDQCPDRAEDPDNFEDADGCPEVDNDGDGLCDPHITNSAGLCHRIDACPLDPETINGVEDSDGCPDEGTPLFEEFEGQLMLSSPIQFRLSKPEIRAASFPAIDQIAAFLDNRVDVKTLSVSAANLGRADAIRARLVAQGVAVERIQTTEDPTLAADAIRFEISRQ